MRGYCQRIVLFLCRNCVKTINQYLYQAKKMRRDDSSAAQQYPFDANNPLQLRRGSDQEARRSLIEKYQGDLNKTEDDNEVSYNVGNKKPGSNGGNDTMQQLEDDIQKSSKKKLYLGLGIGLTVIGVIVLILVLTLDKKGDHHHDDPVDPPNPFVPTDHSPNPYQITMIEDPITPYSARLYRLTRNSTRVNFTESMKSYAIETKTNKFIENATLKTQVMFNAFNTMRVSIEKDDGHYKVSEDFLSGDFSKEKSQNSRNLNGMNSKFSVGIKSPSSGNNSYFSINAYYNPTSGPENDFLTTQDQEFILMTHYTQISFLVRSSHFLGWSDSQTQSLYYPSGNYSIFATKQNPNAHPFVMFQITGTNKFAGLYMLNSAPITMELNVTEQKSKLTFRANSDNMEFYIFYGPTFDQVVRQYQQLIGRPKIVPLWAHGLFSQSPSFNDSKNALDAIAGFEQIKFMLGGLVLPMDYNQEYVAGSSQLVKDIRAKYPNGKDLQLIYPFSHFVPDNNKVQWSQEFINSNGDTSFLFSVRAEDVALQVMMNEVNGWCMDVFNPKFVSEFLEPKLLRNLQNMYSSVWLQENYPELSNFNHQFKDEWNITYRAGGNAFSYNSTTLPEQAQHNLDGSLKTEYHANTHNLFGSTFAKQVIMNMPTFRNQLQRPFVLSDSTFPGLGQYGVAHFPPSQEDGASYDDLRKQVKNMMSLSISALPNVGVRMCDFNKKQTFDSYLCGKYFQASIFTPLALYSDQMPNITRQPFYPGLIDKQTLLDYDQILMIRNIMLSYQRTQMMLLERWGGALFRPMIAEFSPENLANPDSLDMFMWGSDVMVDFKITDSKEDRILIFPKGSDWVSLISYDTFQGGHNITIKHNEYFDLGLYQKAGTIVAQQDPSGAKSVADLRNATIKISIALKEGVAYGNIYLEDGGESGFRSELHEVWVEGQVIGFRQQETLSMNNQANDTIIDSIRVSFVDGPVNTACALLKDMRTVLPLTVGPYDIESRQAFIQTHNPDNYDSSLRINQIAYVYFGHSDKNVTCNHTLFSYTLKEEATPSDLVYEATLESKLSLIMPKYFPNQYLKVELLSNHSVFVQLSDKKLTEKSSDRELPTEIIDRNFTFIKAGEKGWKIRDVLKINDDPSSTQFCYQIVNPWNGSEILMSTCVEPQAQHKYHNVFNFEQRFSKKGRFFGLGERKGEFFLQDDTQYQLYNNNNNLRSSVGAMGDQNEHGRNGFHPIIYSNVLNSTNLTAMVFFTGHGLEVTFDEEKDIEGAAFSVHSSSQDIEFVFIFNLHLLQTVQQVHAHLNPGTLLQNYINPVTLPPPQWAFGHFTTILRDEHTQTPLFSKSIRGYLEQLPKEFALEGLYLDSLDMDHGNSLTLEQGFYNKTEVSWMAENKYALIQRSESGFPKQGRFDKDKLHELVDSKDIKIKTLDNKDQISTDNNGEVVFIDYSKPDSKDFVSKMVSDFCSEQNFTSNLLGVSLIRNEISLPQCSVASCFVNYDDFPESTWFIHKSGNLDMNINTPFQVKRALGLEEQLHNVNGLIEQYAYKNSDSKVPLVISDSTTLLSGKLGNVARILDYYDLTSETELQLLSKQIQLQSLLGLPMVSVRFKGFAAQLQSNHDLVKRAILLSTYSSGPSVLEFYSMASRELSASEKKEFAQLLNLRYQLSTYIRTQIFKQIILGTPFIHPVSFRFPYADQQVGTSFMFGPAIVATTDLQYSRQNLGLPTNRVFCTAYQLSTDPTFCFSDGQIPSKYDGKSQVILSAGSITPLFSYNKSEQIELSRGNLTNQMLDLHVLPYMNMSHGDILLDDGMSVNDQYCFLYMQMENETISITDISKSHGGKAENCSAFKMQTFTTLYLYDYKNLTPTSNGYQSAYINGGEYILDLIELDSSESVGVFRTIQNQTFNGQLQLSQIKTIVFSLDIPEPPKNSFATVQ